MANISSWGFYKLADMASQRVTTVGIDVVNNAVLESIAAYQAELDGVMSAFVDKVTYHSKRYLLPGAGTLQPLDQWGNPLPRIPGGYYDIGLPIRGGGDAWGDNRVTRAKMTVEEADRFTAMVTSADVDWNIRHMLAAIFTNTTYVFPDELHGNLTVQSLANGDTVTYTKRNGTVATDNHYLGQANAIGAGADNPYPVLYSELFEHPSNQGPFVAYIPTNLVATTTALATFFDVDDPDIRRGADSDVLTGRFTPPFGELLGKADKMWIVQWDRLPDSRIIAQAMGASSKPIAMREYPEPELQGLFPEFQDVDGNRHLNKFIRYAGFGAQNRVAAAVMEISDASYDIPTGYTAPLPV
jgi:hypothetical protein